MNRTCSFSGTHFLLTLKLLIRFIKWNWPSYRLVTRWKMHSNQVALLISMRLSPQRHHNLRNHALKIATIFGSTYVCEQTFSRMKHLKSPIRSRLTDEHLHHLLWLAVTNMEPNIDHLISQKQAHSSQWNIIGFCWLQLFFILNIAFFFLFFVHYYK